MSLPIGSVLGGRYRIQARLGEGGMGSVYAVEDTRQPGTLHALKVLLDDGSLSPEDVAWAAQHFEDEVRLLAHLRHPRIPRFIERCDVAGRRCLIMEYIPGQTLEERLARDRAPLPEADVLRWMLAVCDVLSYLHDQHPPVIVRDLKPGNIMITPTGDVRLIDFGIARTYKPGQLSNTENLGTAAYASPEHHGRAQTDARSDIYSLGATMYHLLTNAEPTPMETPLPGALRRRVPGLSLATEEVVRKAMALDPARRYATAREARAAISSALAALGTTAPPPPTLPTRQPVVTRPVPTPASARSRSPQMSPRGAVRSAVRVPSPRGTTQGAGAIGPRCPRCGQMNRAGAKFCARDGAPLSGTARPRTGIPAVVSSAPVQSASVTRIVPPPTQVLQTRRVRELVGAGYYAQAVRQAEAALKANPGNAELYALLGEAHSALGRHRAAADAHAESARLRPTADTLRREGEARYRAGEYALAQIALTRARHLDARDPEICRLLAVVCLAQGHIAQAEGEARDGLTLTPRSAGLLIILGDIARARGARDQAKSAYSDAIAADSTATEAYTGLGRVYLDSGAPREAVRALEDGSRHAPPSAALLTTLGAAYAATGHTARAREVLRQALRLDPTNGEAQTLLASL